MAKDLLENKFKSERDTESSALTILDNKDSTSLVPSLISTGNEADVMTGVSTLSQPVSVEKGRGTKFKVII